MIEDQDFQKLKSWIIETKRYNALSASDVLSRLKRLNRILSFSQFEHLGNWMYYLLEVEQQEEFKKLSISVKSQMRKAWKIYVEYKNKPTTD